jgi:hypothetical protein
MQGVTFLKTCLFRLLAMLLLAVSAGFVVVPDSNPYSADKTFVKQHSPADSFVLMLTADDKEDLDEDGTIGVQLAPEFSAEFISLVTFANSCKAKARPIVKMNTSQAYIFHRQLLI